MGLFELFWETKQNSQIQEASSDAHQARSAAREASLKIADLERSLDRLALINRALWELMQDRLRLTEEDLIEKVSEIDLRDGALDGKYDRGKDSSAPGDALRTCDRCGRVMNARHVRCIYCGSATFGGNVFDGVK